MPLLEATVKFGNLLGVEVGEGFYAMQDGKAYSKRSETEDKKFESASGEVEISSDALFSAQMAYEASERIKEGEEPKSVRER
jgi:hypothetical protein